MMKTIKLYFLFIILIYIIWTIIVIKFLNKGNKYKRKILLLEETDLDEKQFNKTYDIKCEYCNTQFNTSNETCPNCGGQYQNNKTYIEKSIESNKEYYNFLQKIENEIREKYGMYYKVIKDLRKNMFVNHSFFNFEINSPNREKIEKVAIFCEYCGTKVDMIINEEKNCPNCNSLLKENTQLLAYKKKNEVIELEYKKYQELNELLAEQNEKNQKFDKKLTKNYWFAKLFFLLSFLIPIIPTYLINKYLDNKTIENINKILLIIGQSFIYIFLAYLFYMIFIKKKDK